jgi:exodeoxyribonuclease V alpha subunit
VFDTTEQIIMREDIESIEHGYAITVHKSQGSQFKRVIVVLSASRILDRTLVYTAITRGVEQVVLVGDIGAASRAVVSAPTASTRLTGLGRMLGLTGAA